MPWLLVEGRMSIELITGKDVAFLDSGQFPIVMNALLAAEAGQNRIPILDLTITTRTKVVLQVSNADKFVAERLSCV
jgi:hypothetical protein